MVGRHIAVARASVGHYQGSDQDERAMLTCLSECSGGGKELAVCAFDNDDYRPFLSRGPSLRQREIVLNRVSGGSFQLRWFRSLSEGRGRRVAQYQQAAEDALEQH